MSGRTLAPDYFHLLISDSIARDRDGPNTYHPAILAGHGCLVSGLEAKAVNPLLPLLGERGKKLVLGLGLWVSLDRLGILQQSFDRYKELQPGVGQWIGGGSHVCHWWGRVIQCCRTPPLA